jgi:hypothetical protein
MRVSVFALILLCSLLLASCSRNKLPSIKDTETLRKDCATLFQQFPIIMDTNQIAKYGDGYTNQIVRDIPTKNWPFSIQNLKPFQVKRSRFGIDIWIRTNKNPTETISGNWTAKGYFVPCSSFSIYGNRFSNVPFYKQTDLPGIYEISIPAVAD